MKFLTTEEVNGRLLYIIDLQWGLIKDMMKALGPFEAFEEQLKKISEAKKEVGL